MNHDNANLDSDSSASDPTLSAINGNGRAGTWDDLEGQKENNDIEAVVQLSLDELAKSKLRKARIPDLVNVPEYCPVRHRAGIARLLKILEGKDPRLDSAPKVWTLFVLAKYFDCTTAVVRVQFLKLPYLMLIYNRIRWTGL